MAPNGIPRLFYPTDIRLRQLVNSRYTFRFYDWTNLSDMAYLCIPANWAAGSRRYFDIENETDSCHGIELLDCWYKLNVYGYRLFF